MHKKTYFITGGGTGGHIYPAIAVGDTLLELGEAKKIYYIGNPDNLEANIVKDKNFTFLPVKSSGMPRKACLKIISWAVSMFFAWLRCCFYIAKYKPDVIFATGGYVSAPVLFAGLTMRIPYVLHDCDANPGLVSRKLAPYANSISVAFDAACKKLNNPNCYINGNPIRKEFKTLDKKTARKNLNLDDKITVAIIGGSQGAKKINNSAVEILKTLTQDFDVQVIFQTGSKNFEEVSEKLKNIYPGYENDKNLIIKPYFNNMVEVLKSSDIALSRAGSLSISELCASKVGTIFIPYPYAAADHQRKNARFMSDCGAGLYLEDEDTTPQMLLELLKSLISDKEKLSELQNHALELAVYDGAERIVKQIMEV